VLDWPVDSDLARDDQSFWDLLHFSHSIARLEGSSWVPRRSARHAGGLALDGSGGLGSER
jgi:hypothetical protein